MKKVVKYFLCAGFLLYCKLLYQQQTKTPLPYVTKEQISRSYLAKGYSLLGFAEDSIKEEGKVFAVLIFNKNGEDTLLNTKQPVKRIALVLMGRNKQQLLKVVENKNLVYHYNYDLNFKESFVGVTAANGQFTIDHYGGFATRWGRSTTFVYSAKEKTWLFNKDEQSTFISGVPDNEKEETETITTAKQTGKITCANFDIYKPLTR